MATLRHHHRRLGRGASGRRGMTLLEVVLATCILSVLTVTMTAALQCQVRLLRSQQSLSLNGSAHSITDWIGERVRRADGFTILASDRLRIVTDTTAGVRVEEIYQQDDQLMLQSGGVTEQVAGAIDSIAFSDASGAGVAVTVTVQLAPETSGAEPTAVTRQIPLDWIRR